MAVSKGIGLTIFILGIGLIIYGLVEVVASTGFMGSIFPGLKIIGPVLLSLGILLFLFGGYNLFFK